MKKFLIFSFLFLAFNWIVKAQPTFIQKKIFLPESYTANSRDVIETTSNNYVMLGFTIDSIGNQFHQRMTLAGLDQNGNLTWRKSYGNNNFTYIPYIWSAGMMIKKNNFLYTATTVNDSNLLQPGVFIKFNFTGDTVWQKKFYEANSQLYFIALAPSIDNGFLITGVVKSNTSTVGGVYLLKTDANGNMLWRKNIYKTNNETQYGHKVIQDSLTKRIIVVGTQELGATANCANTLILDSLGNIITQKSFFGGSPSAIIDLIQTYDKNFITVGSITNGPVINTFPTSKSALVKFDINGNILANIDCDTFTLVNWFNNIVELKNGDLIMGGPYSAKFNQGLGLNDITRITKYDKNLNFLWKKYYDLYTNNGNEELIRGLNITSTGQIIFTCDIAGGTNMPPPFPYMFFKTDTSFCDVNSIGCYNFTGINENAYRENSFNIFPNPASETITILINESKFENSEIEIINYIGQTVLKTKFKKELNVSELSDGVYFLQIKNSQNQMAIKRLVIAR